MVSDSESEEEDEEVEEDDDGDDDGKVMMISDSEDDTENEEQQPQQQEAEGNEVTDDSRNKQKGCTGTFTRPEKRPQSETTEPAKKKRKLCGSPQVFHRFALSPKKRRKKRGSGWAETYNTNESIQRKTQRLHNSLHWLKNK